jgi:hypothetical protein
VLSYQRTYFQATLKIIKPDVPSDAPIQSIFPFLSTGSSGGTRNHSAPSTGAIAIPPQNISILLEIA